MTLAPNGAVTVDAFLGGRVEAVQPDDGGHRSGLEAALLAAAIDAPFAGTLVDLGAGAGVAGMCAAARCRASNVLLVERDQTAVAAARAALALPANRGFADRVSIAVTDIGASEPARVAAGVGRAFADLVILNPPFYRADAGTMSPRPNRASAHVLGGDGLETWLRVAASVLKPGGRVIAIFRADGLGELLAAMAGRFGAVAVMPIHPRAGTPAHRILVRGIKGNRGPLAILPGLALHDRAGGAYLPAVDAILRDGAGLADANPAWAE